MRRNSVGGQNNSELGPVILAKTVRAKSGGGRGRNTQRPELVDVLEPSTSAVSGKPRPDDFIQQIVNEMKIRGYARKTISNYRANVVALLRWHGGMPHQINRNHVRAFLLTIADSELSRSKLAGALSAIRAVFDDFCCRQVTLGLVTPRGAKKLPIILSPDEVQQIIDACPSFRDKTLVSLMYATGMRVSEVAKLKWREVDFERNCINVIDGKGNVDRNVILPDSYRSVLAELAAHRLPTDYLFPSEDGRQGRHLSPRTIQRAVERATRLAGIGKRVTPHAFRHAFATHLFEDNTDIRLIQKYLGHANLETTCIYTHVAQRVQTTAKSPLDRLAEREVSSPPNSAPSKDRQTKSVGKMRIHSNPIDRDPKRLAVRVEITSAAVPVVLDGIIASEPRTGWVALQLPTIERWSEPLSRLPTQVRQRIEQPEFYESLQQAIACRFQPCQRDGPIKLGDRKPNMKRVPKALE